MRILAFSDVYRWNGYKRLVERYKPQIVALAGDLTSDGGAHFWRAALEYVPEYKKKIEALHMERIRCLWRENQPALAQRRKRHVHVPLRPGPATREVMDRLRELRDRAHKEPAYLAARQRMHVKRFYDFLRYAGRASTVLVVKGDHDDDFPGDYDPSRIDGIPGCHEISGKTYVFGKLVFLGLGFQQAGYRRPLRRFIGDFRGRVGIVIAHVPEKNLRLVTELRPNLLIRGHFGYGRHVIDGVAAAFTSKAHAIIEIGSTGSPRIQGCEISLAPTQEVRSHSPTVRLQ